MPAERSQPCELATRNDLTQRIPGADLPTPEPMSAAPTPSPPPTSHTAMSGSTRAGDEILEDSRLTETSQPPSPGATLPASQLDTLAPENAPIELRRSIESLSRLDDNIGQVFGGKYYIERLLGEGGMGVVYLARHQAINKRVAIKLLHGDATRDPEVVERFKVEARAASSVGNEHIVDVTDFAELPNGWTYFVMEYLDGQPLSRLYHELITVPTPRLARIAHQMAQGLAAAHAAGIVHRDLKPDNVFLCSRNNDGDFVKILDFGIAKVGQGVTNITKAGAIFGTPHYMSPEQAAGSPVDHRTDIYSLGVILYEGAVGRVPFDADNFMGILTQHMYKAPVPPRAVPECPADLPAGFEVIIMRCLRKDPEERYATMDDLAADLERLLRGEVPQAARDVMALSAGYQFIANNAVAAGVTKPLPGAPPAEATASRKLTTLHVLMALVVVLTGMLAGVALGTHKSRSQGAKATASATSAVPHVRMASSAQTAEPPLPVASPPSGVVPKPPRVVLVTSPTPGAHLFENTRDIGELPVNVDVDELEPKVVTVRARGYQDKQLTLDSHGPAKVNVTLTRQRTWSPSDPLPRASDRKLPDDPWR